MAPTLTLGIVKPDAVAGGKAGKIVAHLEGAGFGVRAARLVRLTQSQAGASPLPSSNRSKPRASR